MSRICSVCEKRKMGGHKVSHSNRKSNRTWEVNVQKVRVAKPDGSSVSEYVCAKCLKGGKVERA